eukprot:CAMPEP_0181333766 /NCGR_PEP_ID=MMETSP1101-20121128/25866_1 /TAXON_ID=46948 /ORGANISM="Rhodomonas abbreviata, Strain Caron Lab Isolate" /LENGTH=42 /DNA_ID= /DNA_START= /DNA_END= /DNA_ORIENTATION=
MTVFALLCCNLALGEVASRGQMGYTRWGGKDSVRMEGVAVRQ